VSIVYLMIPWLTVDVLRQGSPTLFLEIFAPTPVVTNYSVDKLSNYWIRCTRLGLEWTYRKVALHEQGRRTLSQAIDLKAGRPRKYGKWQVHFLIHKHISSANMVQQLNYYDHISSIEILWEHLYIWQPSTSYQCTYPMTLKYLHAYTKNLQASVI
jgi:hypothetical protein